MSPTSSEPTDSAPTSSEPTDRFRRSFAIVVTALIVLCAALFAVTAFQGPKLSSFQADVAPGSDQQLRLFANQPLASVAADQVTITPTVPFAVETSGKIIAVRFTAELAYNTDYTVTVSSVRGTQREQSSEFRETFTTADPTLYYLQRNPDGDRIFRGGIADTERSVVYQADHIQEFTVVARLLAVVTTNDDGTSTLSLVSLTDGVAEKVPLPGAGTVTLLHASDIGASLGFVFTSEGDDPDREFLRTLETVDLSSGRELVPALDLNGEVMHVLDWQYVPGRQSFIAQDIDISVLLIDPVGPAVLPLGQYLTLSHVSTDGATLTASDSFGFVSLGIASFDEQRVEPSPLGNALPFGGEVQVLASGGRLQRVVVYNEATARFDNYLVEDDGSASRVVYGTSGSPGSILSFRISPNEQYVAVEIIPNVAESVSDGYPVNPRSTTVTTVIVDIATGAQVASFEGFDLRW